jgi:hypothetical protein
MDKLAAYLPYLVPAVVVVVSWLLREAVRVGKLQKSHADRIQAVLDALVRTPSPGSPAGQFPPDECVGESCGLVAGKLNLNEAGVALLAREARLVETVGNLSSAAARREAAVLLAKSGALGRALYAEESVR